MCGIKLQEYLRAEGVELPVIIITGYGDVTSAVQAMRAGAEAFLEKPCDDQQLWQAICQAMESQAVSRRQRVARLEIRCRLATLTPDEHQVLQRLMAGNPNKTIARDLDLGLRTVESAPGQHPAQNAGLVAGGIGADGDAVRRISRKCEREGRDCRRRPGEPWDRGADCESGLDRKTAFAWLAAIFSFCAGCFPSAFRPAKMWPSILTLPTSRCRMGR